MDNLDLWNSVEKTNPKHTKKVTFGRAITAIDPYHQMKNATEKFGPVGIGWGWTVEKVEYTPTNEIALLVRLWHTEKSNTFDQWGQASLYIDKAEQKKDTDCFKKATTDGVTKCLSLIGFNADIFLGKFEDNKYVQEVTREFAARENPEVMAIQKMIDSNDTAQVFKEWQGLISSNWNNLTLEQTTALNNMVKNGGDNNA